ncbi:MAG: glycosyltransferase family 1 protein [Candidatus Saccharibacteria bacterium]|nr:glycosyltransferase family 1 protein [Candidatus Saccharibacteria bacterium]
MKIRVEVSSLASKNMSGVASYTKMLVEALDENPNIVTFASYFDFFNRQPEPKIKLKQTLEKNSLVPLRVYAKSQSYNFAPPFDVLLPRVDLTIFPNFATWPTIKSKLRATVIHDLTYMYYPDAVEINNLPHLQRVVPRSVKQADIIITPSEAVKAEIVKEFSVSPDKCIVTTIPPDSKYLRKNNNEIHKKYGIPTEKFIYFVGTLEPRKDLPTLIEAYRKLPNSIKDECCLVLAGGNGWKTEKSRKAIDDAKEAGENVIHVGFIDGDDGPAFFQQASLYVMPSTYEGFGIPVLEAMASGCPVIASDIPVLREVAGDAALFAKVGDSDSFCGAIKKLIGNHDLQKELVEKGKKRLNNFSPAKNAEIIFNKVETLLKS